MMSTPPSRSRTARATRAQPSAVATSAATNRSVSLRSAGAVRAVVRTLTPSSRSRVTTASPIPCVPPVTSARRPSNSRSWLTNDSQPLVRIDQVLLTRGLLAIHRDLLESERLGERDFLGVGARERGLDLGRDSLA